MNHIVQQLMQQAQESVDQCVDSAQLTQLRVEYLGKKGKLTTILKQLGGMPADQRKQLGQALNEAKTGLLALFAHKKDALDAETLAKALAEESIDITLPGRQGYIGSAHPITQTTQRIISIFQQLGFNIATGPEIEDEFHNFEALNTPAHHPARAMQDTFYVSDQRLLRSHTSPVQIRTMRQSSPPFRLIAPGRVYRCDSDVTHTPMFHQVEGFVVDKSTHFGDLKAVIQTFLASFFEKSCPVRLRASYFPFTEPSAEVDIQCVKCSGAGCRICSYTGWLEVLGCGMVHPNVLTGCGLDPESYQGYAFGMGVERLCMLYYGVTDIRQFYENDLNFLRQFASL